MAKTKCIRSGVDLGRSINYGRVVIYRSDCKVDEPWCSKRQKKGRV